MPIVKNNKIKILISHSMYFFLIKFCLLTSANFQGSKLMLFFKVLPHIIIWFGKRAAIEKGKERKVTCNK